jgi:hypothetical protein
MIFLGIELSTAGDVVIARLPDGRKVRLVQIVSDVVSKRHKSRRDLEHVVGTLQFASIVVFGGANKLRIAYTILQMFPRSTRTLFGVTP